MAYTFNGIGTTFYGQCDWRPDGSFRTTRWFVVFWIPLFPLMSHRLRRNLRADKRGFFGYSTGYYLMENLPIDFNQVTPHLAWPRRSARASPLWMAVPVYLGKRRMPNDGFRWLWRTTQTLTNLSLMS